MAVELEMSVGSMDKNELYSWLIEEGIPEQFASILKENYIDGEEFLNLSEKDIREMVPPMGIAKKIFRLNPKTSNVVSSICSPDGRSTSFSPPPLSSLQYTSPESPTCSISSNSTVLSTPATSASSIIIPDKWRHETELCIQAKDLDTAARSEIARTLITLLTSKFGTNFGRREIEEVGRKLILKYPFMADTMGNGYTSWTDKMLQSHRNRIKIGRKKSKELGHIDDCSTPPKKAKMTEQEKLTRRYPVKVLATSYEDAESLEMHKKAIGEELKKQKPRDLYLIPLMQSTFAERRMYIQNDAKSVRDIIHKYPELNRPSLIETEMGIVVNDSSIKKSFEKQWSEFIPAILNYGQKGKRKKNIKNILSQLSEADDYSKQVTALKILVEALHCTSSYFFKECQIDDTPENIAEQTDNTSPYFISFVGEQIQFFIIIEKKVLCQVPNIQSAIFLTFSSYYVFHLKYPKPVETLLFFFQDNILSYPDSLKRPGTYLAVTSDITKLK